MATERRAEAEWYGDLKTGEGTLSTESGVLDGADYDFESRFEEGSTTNPEELIGAAHAGCFSMALANELASDGYDPETIETDATVDFDAGGPEIEAVHLETHGTVQDIDGGTFAKYADDAKENCPVSQALTGVEITVDATLES